MFKERLREILEETYNFGFNDAQFSGDSGGNFKSTIAQDQLSEILKLVKSTVEDAPVNKFAKYTCCLENGLNARNIILTNLGGDK